MTLFEVARQRQPSIIFIDEVDAFMIERSNSENECTRKVKTKLFIQMDGGRSSDDDQVRPQDLDQAALRRFGRHMYVPLPDAKARERMIFNLLCESPTVKANLSTKDINDIVASSALNSAADVTNVCRDAALTPLREMDNIEGIQAEDIRPVTKKDVMKSLGNVKPSVNFDELSVLENWRPQK